MACVSSGVRGSHAQKVVGSVGMIYKRSGWSCLPYLLRWNCEQRILFDVDIVGHEDCSTYMDPLFSNKLRMKIFFRNIFLQMENMT